MLLAGMVPTRGKSKTKLGWKRFLRRVYKAGAAQLADGIGFHPFAAFWHRSIPRVLAKVEALMASIQGIMSRYGDADKDVWVTEIGLSTTGRPGFSKSEQADGLAAMYRLFAGMPAVPAVIVAWLTIRSREKTWYGEVAASTALSAVAIPVERIKGLPVLAAARMSATSTISKDAILCATTPKSSR